MALKVGYSTGKKERTSNSSRGVTRGSGRNSSVAAGISTGRTGSSKIEVGYKAGQNDAGRNTAPDPKNRSKPFSPGGRA